MRVGQTWLSSGQTIFSRFVAFTEESMKIGFIGTGTMGQPMLANLVKKGFQAVAYDMVPAALDAAGRLRAERAGSAASAAPGPGLGVTKVPASAHGEAAHFCARRGTPGGAR